MLQYRFPRSSSKNFADALEFAQGLEGFREDGEFFWVDFGDDDVPSAEFVELEKLSGKWKGSGYFLDGRRVAKTTWWDATKPIGKMLPANTECDWIESEAWLSWPNPENLVVGESHRQEGLRKLAQVSERTLTIKPVEVLFQRDPDNAYDPNAVKALVKGVHVGFLPKDIAAIVAPVMDQRQILEMEFAGVLSGKESLGVHIWPNRALSNAIRISDPSCPMLARFHSDPSEAFREYKRALQTPGSQVSTPKPLIGEAKYGPSCSLGGDELLYEKHGLSITPRVIRAPSMSFQMANLNGTRIVDLKAVNAGGLYAFGCFGLVGLFVVFFIGAAFNPGSSSIMYSIFGVLAMVGGVGIVSQANQNNQWAVQINNNGVWVNLCIRMTQEGARELDAAVNEGFSRLRSSR